MRFLRILFLGLIATLIHSCSTEEDIPSPVEPSIENPTENVYYAHNKWIYSEMNQHYLWREDMPDSIDCDYDQAPSDFFRSILSSKDRFSYMLTNPYYEPSEKINIGFSYQDYMDLKGNKASLILYVQNDEARTKGIRRGAWINILSKTDGQVSYNPVSLEEDGSFRYSKETITLSISKPTKQSTVLLDSIYNQHVGYICYTEFDEIEDLIGSLTKFKTNNIKELILDLRYNPGGYVKTCKYLANCIAPEKAYGNIFQITKYNDILSKENILDTGNPYLYDNFGFPTIDPDKDKGGYPIIPLNLSRLFVLTSKYTASASEATILCLKPYMEVIQIGENTVGKGVGSYTIYDKKYKYAIQPITMQYYNQLDQTVSNEGLEPDLFIEDGYNTSKKEIGDTAEPLLLSALSWILPSDYYFENVSRSRTFNNEISLTPIGEPSYVTEFNNKQYNESN